MKSLLMNKLNFLKKLILKIILFFLILIASIEIFLRIMGFGDPVLYLSDSNYSLKPNQEVKRFKGSKIIINELGMRTNFDWKNKKKMNKILFFGDSVSFGGSYIDNNDLFSEKFCKINFNSICGNYGTNGYKLENISLRIDEIANSFNFNRLIIVTSSSLSKGKSIFSDFPFYEKFDHKILKSTTEVANHFLFKYKIIDNYHKNKKFDSINRNNGNFPIENFEKVIKKLIDKKVKVNIFILPTLENLDRKKKFKHLLEDLKIENSTIINLYDEIINQNYKDLYFNNAHLNQKGHDYLSKLLYKLVK